MERRAFLQLATLTALGIAGEALVGCSIPQRSFGGPPHRKGKVFLSLEGPNSSSSVLRIWDWDTNEYRDHVVDLTLPHSILQNKFDPAIVYLFEVFGSCLRVDLKTGKSTKIDHLSAGEMFHGHAVQTVSGQHLLCSQLIASSKDPSQNVLILTLRNAETLEKVASVPFHECGNAHQMVLLPGTKIAACGNMAQPDGKAGGAITFLDTEKLVALRQVVFPYPILHITPLSSTEVVGVTRAASQVSAGKAKVNRYGGDSQTNVNAAIENEIVAPGPVCYANLDGSQKMLWDENDQNTLTEGFGISNVPKSRGFLTGHTKSGKVVLWQDTKIVKIFKVENPANILASPDGKEFLVIGAGKVKLFSLETLEELTPRLEMARIHTLSAYSS